MWELYTKWDDHYWHSFRGPSGDSCKARARSLNRNESNSNLGKEFLIRDPSGKDWMKSVNTGSWRIKWVYVKG
jgi:hypothetical protein